jgi:hypothetical protein
LDVRLRDAQRELTRVGSSTYLSELRGMIGADPFTGRIAP